MKKIFRSKRVWTVAAVVVVIGVLVALARRRQARENYAVIKNETKLKQKLHEFGKSLHAALSKLRGTKFDAWIAGLLKMWNGDILLVDRVAPKPFENKRMIIPKYKIASTMTPVEGESSEGTGIDIARLRFMIIFQLVQSSLSQYFQIEDDDMREVTEYIYIVGMVAKKQGFKVKQQYVWH